MENEIKKEKVRHSKFENFLDKADVFSVAFARAVLVKEAERILKEERDDITREFAKDVLKHLGF